jgi:hypothetical protein
MKFTNRCDSFEKKLSLFGKIFTAQETPANQQAKKNSPRDLALKLAAFRGRIGYVGSVPS